VQSSEQFYRDQSPQGDYFDADLADAHRRRVNAQAASATPTMEGSHGESIDMAERFMHTLQQAEASGDIDSLVILFADTADLSSLAITQPLHGRESIRQFWQNYLSVFDRIQSRFTHVSEGNGTITLEWISEGNLVSGESISYRGVSILETQNGQVQHFRTYYDSAAFLPQNAR
jgi:ketosteroid isomerase-like protein